MSRAGVATLLIASACSGSADGPKPEPLPPPISDGGADAVPVPVADTPKAPPVPKRPTRPIEIILRSTPSESEVWVDGAYVGITPQVWGGETGAPHTFMFQKAGYAMAQYRFVPVTTGILHGRLDPVAEDVDAGVLPPREVAPLELVPPSVFDTDAAQLVVPADAFTADAPQIDASTPGLGPPP